jgi:hypothetical protein
MNRFSILFVLSAVMILTALSCSTGPSPVLPGDSKLSSAKIGSGSSQTHLWGLYDVYIDIPTQTATAVENRQAMFTANVVNFLNGKAASLGFKINGTPAGSDYVDVDIDVSITHPFPGLPQYNGNDVRGVFMGDGSAVLSYNPALIYPINGSDQFMLADPVDGFGSPDGYTRWFNKPEFFTGGMPLVQYTQGKVASPGYSGTATINPYKYFTDGLSATDDLWNFLKDNGSQFGQFSSGVTNTRNYYLRFPNTKGVKYSYAVLANWKSETDHPSNAPEAVAISCTVTPDIYWVPPSGTEQGGNLKLDVSIFDWDSHLSAGIMEDYKLIIESTVLAAPYTANSAEMTPVGGGDNYSTYRFDIPANNINSADGNEFWVIVEDQVNNYKNDFGVTNNCGDDKLAAFFRSDLFVSDQSSCLNLVPIVNKLNGLATYIAGKQSYTEWVTEGDQFEGGAPGVDVSNGSISVASGTNVQWVDAQHLSFDIDLTPVATGVYDIVVTNGCGMQKKGIGTSMLSILKSINVVGTPNMDIVTGVGAPRDIGLDPATGNAAVTYDKKFWRKWSNTYTTAFDTNIPNWTDLASSIDGCSSMVFFSSDCNYIPPSNPICWCFGDWNSGNEYMDFYDPVVCNGVVDLANVQGQPHECWALFDRNDASYCYFIQAYNFSNSRFIPSQPPPIFSVIPITAPIYNGEGDTGFVLANVRGLDIAAWDWTNSGTCDVYLLEAQPSTNNAVVEKWRCTQPNQPVFQNSFGENTLVDPLDISVDSSYNVFVLDKTAAGKYILWAFNSSGILIGTSGELTTAQCSGDGLKIDVSVNPSPDEIHLLHTKGVTRFNMP